MWNNDGWGTWNYEPALPRPGMYIQIEGLRKFTREPYRDEGIVLRVRKTGFDVSPAPKQYGLIQRWRERKPRGLTMLERMARMPTPHSYPPEPAINCRCVIVKPGDKS